MIVDLRSDTVTQPTEEMKNAMFEAELGDDVLGDDPTVIKLEKKAAKIFGKESALFCPSGTMTNQIAIKVHTNAPGEVICDSLAHIYRYEGGGIGFNSALATNLVEGDRGRFTVDQLKAAVKVDDVHFPPSQLVSIENTCNKGGGSIWNLTEIKNISKYCQEQNIPIHLDGARVFNALVESKTDPEELGKHFDSISICLSKGLGAPVGSLLLGNQKFIHHSRRIRKVLGGGMRQSGLLAAAGIYALDNNIQRLKIDHENAKYISEILKKKNWVKDIEPVETNILIFKIQDNIEQDDFLLKLEKLGILAVGMGPQTIRFVSHLDIDDSKMDYLATSLKSLSF